MVRLILKLRWLAAVTAFFAALHAVGFMAIGIARGTIGYRLILEGPPWDGEESPGIHLARSTDSFLIALVFVVFAIGVCTLFLPHRNDPNLESIPGWMRVKSLSELKFLLWEAILLALVIASVEGFVASSRELTWTALILPIAIFILALGLFFAKRAD
ncbi:MAG TPA: YqhA family protein [Terriglobia bacterium]|nr:YqhA family protein [Terriglobia bacterium]